MPPADTLRRWPIWATACAAVLLVLQFPVFNPADGIRADGVVYVGGARSLLAGEGYRYAVFEGAPRIGLYPPGWSVALMPAVALAKVTGWGAWVQVWSMACSLVMVYGGVRFLCGRGMPPTVAGGIMMSILVTPVWRETVRWSNSEPLYMAILFAWLLPAVWERPPGSTREWLGIGLACAALLLTRTAAVAVLPAIGLASLLTRRPAWMAAALGPTLLAMVAWVAWSRGLVGYKEMFESEVLRLTGRPDGRGLQLAENLRHLLEGGPLVHCLFPALFPVPQAIARMLPPVRAFPWILAGLVQWGGLLAITAALWRRWKVGGAAARGTWLGIAALGGTVAVHCALVLSIPVPVGSLPRYMLPLAPLLGWALWEAFRTLVPDRPVAQARLAQCATVLLTLNVGLGVGVTRTGYPGQDGVRSKDDLVGIARGLRAMSADGAPPRVAVDIRNPLLDLVDTLGRPVITDYVDPVDVWQPVRHRDQGHPRADYLVVETREIERRPLLVGLERVVTNRSYVAFRLEPDWEARFRAERGIPAPR